MPRTGHVGACSACAHPACRGPRRPGRPTVSRPGASMTRASPARTLAARAALACGSLVALGRRRPPQPTPPAQALQPARPGRRRRADHPSRRCRRRRASSACPRDADVDNPAVTPSTRRSPPRPTRAPRAVRRGPRAPTRPGTTLDADRRAQPTVAGDVVRYQQRVDGVPVARRRGRRQPARRTASCRRCWRTPPTGPALARGDRHRGATPRRRHARRSRRAPAPGAGVTVESQGRWLLDAALIGGSLRRRRRTVWRFEVTRGAAERRQILVDDRTGARR